MARLARGDAEVAADGCSLRIGTLLALSDPLPIQAGQFVLPIDLPWWTGDVVLQAAALDATAPRGFVATPGLEVRVR